MLFKIHSDTVCYPAAVFFLLLPEILIFVASGSLSLPNTPEILSRVESALAKIPAPTSPGQFLAELQLSAPLLATSIIETAPDSAVFYAAAKHYPEQYRVYQRFIFDKEPQFVSTATVMLSPKLDTTGAPCYLLIGFLPGTEPPIEPWLMHAPKNPEAQALRDAAVVYWNCHARRAEEWPYHKGTEQPAPPAVAGE